MKDVIERLKEQSGTFAFPFISQEVFCPGMTLRDYFAAKAMQTAFTESTFGFTKHDYEMLSKVSYAMADAMIKAREE
jgi:hypothetical protein